MGDSFESTYASPAVACVIELGVGRNSDRNTLASREPKPPLAGPATAGVIELGVVWDYYLRTCTAALDIATRTLIGSAIGISVDSRDHVFIVHRQGSLNESTGYYDSWVVESVYGTPFIVDLSRAYAIDLSCFDLTKPCGKCEWVWTPDKY